MLSPQPERAVEKTGELGEVRPLKQEDRISDDRIKSLPMEPRKKRLREVDKSAAEMNDELPDLIARLPAKEPPPKPELPKPEVPPKENLVVTIPQPLILAANRVRGKGYDIVLSSISTVPPSKECDDAGKSWPCGTMARTALRKLVRGRTLKCVLGDPTDTKFLPATCSVRGRDLGRWLVSQGWAVATGAEVSGFQKRAKLQGRGLWRGSADAVALAKESH